MASSFVELLDINASLLIVDISLYIKRFLTTRSDLQISEPLFQQLSSLEASDWGNRVATYSWGPIVSYSGYQANSNRRQWRKKVKNLNHVPDRKIYHCGIKYRLFRILSMYEIRKIARRAWYLTRKLRRGRQSRQLRQLFSRFANFAEVTNFEAELQVSDDQSEAGSQLVEKKWGIGLLSDNR
ncbi:hypothetical protein BDP27DRAFT_1369997 [Rhodocollybia butyracea]|uniref:Uncharacterized protein n=1 Tax=Rhodocollybia butyracea TaxID=206335 RepID=A0A9P5PCR9_9AGAR|nr:hypothetical protein BDP27DRAFT_1376595 [Rhodocollybia butyracea]KAF9061063.1 hypothetical protein BDP27DRAFT_1369997 [Rhodocollybia butyracea]